MGSIKMKVPPEYGETLRRAVLADVDFWASAMTQEQARIQEAREGPPEPDKVDLRYQDQADQQTALAETGVLLEQIPAPGAKLEAELQASSGAFVGVTDEAMRICIKDLAHWLDYSPLDGEVLRKKMGELDWWITQAAAAEAAAVNGGGS
jgi:hypothetical protein